MDRVEKYLGEAKTPKWANDPYKFRSEMVKRLKVVADQIEDIWISEDRYYPGFEQNKQHYNQVNRQFDMLDKAIFKLETEALKAKKVK
jgi:hypothetical protein